MLMLPVPVQEQLQDGPCSETEQTALLNRIHTVREALGPELAAQANTVTGRSFEADCDALAALVQSGKVTASQGEAKLGALLDSAVERISADIKAAPAAAENAAGCSRYRPYRGEVFR